MSAATLSYIPEGVEAAFEREQLIALKHAHRSDTPGSKLKHRSSSSSSTSSSTSSKRRHRRKHGSPRGASRSSSPSAMSASREHRWHEKLLRRGRDGAASSSRHLFSKSRGVLGRFAERRSGGSGRSLLLRNLAQQRNNSMLVDDVAGADDDSKSSSSSSRSRRHRLQKQDSASSSLSSRSRASSSQASRISDADSQQQDRPRQRRRSFKRGDEWVRDMNHRHRLDEQRISMRGFTSEDGFLTRAEALSFSENAENAENAADGKHPAQDDDDELGRRSISDHNLLRFARKGDLTRVRALLNTGLVPIDAPCTEAGRDLGKTALIASAERGHTNVVISLFGRGADLEARDAQGCTALLRAAERGRAEVALLLLSAGARDDARNARGESALVLAANGLSARARKRVFAERLELARSLVERAKPDMSVPGGRLPQYDPGADGALVRHARVRELLDEWAAARCLEKDLHVPSRAALLGESELTSFFMSAHSRFDALTWVKVLLLLCFVVYDVYMQHMGTSWAAYIVYAVLYFCAYSI